MSRMLAYVLAFVVAACVGILFWNSKERSVKTDTKIDQSEPVEFSSLDTWQNYSIASNPFSVRLPAFPQHASEKALDPKSRKILLYDIYAAETLQGNLFAINMITYPETSVQTFNGTLLTNHVVEEMLAQDRENHLVRSQEMTINGISGLEFEVATPHKRIRGFTFFKGKSLYVLTAVTRLDQDNLHEYQHFRNSFTLNEKKQ